jgi:hypothetical protein
MGARLLLTAWEQLLHKCCSIFHFLLVGQEYELEKKLHGGDRKSEAFIQSIPQNEGLKETGQNQYSGVVKGQSDPQPKCR